FKIFRSDRTAIRAPRQSRNDFLRARFLLSRIQRAACKYLSHAARACRTFGVERSLNPQQTDLRIIAESCDPAIFERAACVVFGKIEAWTKVHGQERHSHAMRAGFHWDRQFQPASGISIRSRVATFEIIPLK